MLGPSSRQLKQPIFAAGLSDHKAGRGYKAVIPFIQDANQHLKQRSRYAIISYLPVLALRQQAIAEVLEWLVEGKQIYE